MEQSIQGNKSLHTRFFEFIEMDSLL
jgi:hypothetical protein